ncbi:MAG: hypothetical protein JSV16_12490 [Candidatus Hydrogenedentota bacterium]|nr:MAG: hypothetical protein JSV16_12490 [Candidatus Hydrogenedentota bacterium]
MPRIHSREFPWFSPPDMNRRNHAIEAAKLMLNAAHTAPCTGGVDHMEAELVWGEQEQEEIAEKMEEMSYLPESNRLEETYRIEAVMAREADCILFLGDIRGRNTPFDANCGYCSGPEGCAFVYSRRRTAAGQIDHSDKSLSETLIDGPLCQLHVQNLGFSAGSALWTARNLMVDARPFMTVGMAAKKLGYCRASEFIVGILVSATSKNPFVDVHYNYPVVNMRRMVDSVRKNYIITRQFAPDYRLNPSTKFRKEKKKRGKE